MELNKTMLNDLRQQIREIIKKADEMEKEYAADIKAVHPDYLRSAANLVHYLAFRSFEIDALQTSLRDHGLPSLTHIEGHVMHGLLSLETMLNHLLGEQVWAHRKGLITIREGRTLVNKNTRSLFGYKSKKRSTRIMVTLPATAAEEPRLLRKLLKAGMNSARINCAHDTPDVWKQMIENLRNVQQPMNKRCTVMMDLGGPKLRTGPMAEGPQVIHIRPGRNDLGEVVKPAWVWIAPPDVLPPGGIADAVLPIDEKLFSRLKKNSVITFVDARGKNCKITVERKEKTGRWGLCKDSAYVTSGTVMHLHQLDKSGMTKIHVGELLPLTQHILLKTGDELILTADDKPGENALYDQEGNLQRSAHISCALPEVFRFITPGACVFFDDGKIEGRVEKVSESCLNIQIVGAKDKGSKLRADKGINFPQSELPVSGLTAKDRQDINFVAVHADAVNFSFVNTPADVAELQSVLRQSDRQTGIILKIETQQAFNNLPKILLQAMQTCPVGVMIARGDLAIETGWKNFASIQEEIMRICQAVHLPEIWATQVLENMAKKGVPTRAEITDAALAQRAECVMLNKGYYIEQAVKLLDKILVKMQRYQQKKETILPRLEQAEKLELGQL